MNRPCEVCGQEYAIVSHRQSGGDLVRLCWDCMEKELDE